MTEREMQQHIEEMYAEKVTRATTTEEVRKASVLLIINIRIMQYVLQNGLTTAQAGRAMTLKCREGYLEN